MDVEPVDITADTYGGWRPPATRTPPRSSPRLARIRRTRVRLRPSRAERVLACLVVAVALGGTARVLTTPGQPTAAQLIAGSYARLVAAGTAGFTVDGENPAAGSVDLRHGSLDQTISDLGPSEGTREIVSGGTTYLQISRQPPEWIGGVGLQGLVQQSLGAVLAGPQPLLAALPSATQVRGGPRDRVGATPCRHVLGRLVGDPALRSFGRVPGAADRFGGLVVTADVDSCIAENKLPVSVRATFSVLSPAREAIVPVKSTVTLTLTSVGTPVSISAPPAAEVMSLDR